MKGLVGDLWATVKTLVRVSSFLLAMFFLGPYVEGELSPVMRIDRIHNITHTPGAPGRAERMCFDMDMTKLRQARGVYYVAEVYSDEEPYPYFRGLTHRDGTPWGGRRQNAPPGAYKSNVCVSLHELGWRHRVGVRVRAEFVAPNRPWRIRQPEIWVDLYADNPATK